MIQIVPAQIKLPMTMVSIRTLTIKINQYSRMY